MTRSGIATGGENRTEPGPSGLGPAGSRLRLCAVMFTKLTVEAEPLAPLPSRLATRRRPARQGTGPSKWLFPPRNRPTQENITKQSQFTYKTSYFNNLADICEAKKRPSEAKTSPMAAGSFRWPSEPSLAWAEEG